VLRTGWNREPDGKSRGCSLLDPPDDGDRLARIGDVAEPYGCRSTGLEHGERPAEGASALEREEDREWFADHLQLASLEERCRCIVGIDDDAVLVESENAVAGTVEQLTK
jgi:hypothetical protein